MKLAQIIIDKSPMQRAIHVEDLRAELSDLGFTVVSTDWLQKKLVAEKIRQRQLEDVH